MKIVGIGNMKGGVGKTTTTICLADAISAISGQRVVILDVDPQANLSWALLGPTLFEAQSEAATLTRWLRTVADGGNPDLGATLKPVGLRKLDDSGQAKLALSASNTDLRFEELKFEGSEGGEQEVRLQETLGAALRALKGSFDVALLDCSPAISAFTRAGLRLADCVIVPTPANRLCYESLRTFEEKGLRGLIGTTCPLHVIITRQGAAQGKWEQAKISQVIRDNYSVISPAIPERKEYMKALDPPEIGSHATLKERYGNRIDDLNRLLRSVQEKGILDD